MLRKLMVITCMLGIVCAAIAQKKKNHTGSKKTAGSDSVKINYRETGAPMPPINFLTLDGRFITNKDLDNKANLFIMMFSPTCDHCTNQTMVIEDNIALFKKSKIVLVTLPFAKDQLDYFENTTHVSGYPKMQVTLDSCRYVEKVNNFQTLPQINIYNKDRKLVKVLNGDIELDTLKAYIE